MISKLVVLLLAVGGPSEIHIESLSPVRGAEGTTVLIHGGGFLPSPGEKTAVYFAGPRGSRLQAPVRSVTDRVIETVVPVSAISGDVVVISAASSRKTSSSVTPSLRASNTMAFVVPEDDDEPILKLEKKAGGTEFLEAHPGDTVTFTLLVSNWGDGTAKNARVVDDLPEGLSFVKGSSVSSCATLTSVKEEGDWSELIWTIPSLAPAGSCLITFQAKVDHGLTEEFCDCELVNQAEIQLDGDHGDDEKKVKDSATVHVQCIPKNPKLELAKTSKVLDAPLRPGSWIQYTVTLSNSGNGDAEDVDLIDTLSPLTGGISDLQVSCSKGSPASWSWTATSLSLHFNRVAAGETCTVSFNVQVNDKAKCDNEILNRVTARRKGTEEAGAEDRLKVECLPADLGIVKQAKVLDTPLRPKSWIEYTLAVSNTGEKAALNVQVTDALSALTTLDPGSISISCDKGSTGSNNGSTAALLKVLLGQVKGGETCGITFTVQVKDTARCDDVIANTARAQSGSLDVTSNATQLKVACTPPELKVEKTSEVLDKPLRPGSWLKYTITLRNVGETDAEGVELIDTLSPLTPGLTDLKVVCSKGSAAGWSWTSTTLTLQFNRLRAGEVCTITFNVQVGDKAKCDNEILNRVQVKRQGTEEASASDRRLVDCKPPELQVFKKAVVLDEPLLADSWIGYTITVTNVGERPATNVQVTDAIDPLTALDVGSIEISSDQGSTGEDDGSTASLLKVLLDEVKAGEVIAVRFTVQAKSTARCDDPIRNKARVKFSLADLWTNETVLRVFCPPDLCGSTKTVIDWNGGRVEPGDTLQYTITVINSSKTTATGVRVTDDVPAFTEGFKTLSLPVIPAGAADHSLASPAGANGNGFLDVRNITVPAFGSVEIRFEVRVRQDASRKAVISNTATIHPAREGGKKCFAASRDLVVIPRTPPYEIIESIDLGADPVAVAVNPETHEAVVTMGIFNRVAILDLITGTVLAFVPMEMPHGVAINPKTNQAVVTNLFSDTVTVLDLATRTQAGVVRVGPIPRGVAVNPETNTAVVANNGGAGSASIIDLNTRTVTATLAAGYGADGVAVNAVTNRAAVSNNLAGTVTLINLGDASVEATLATGLNPLGVAFQTDSNLLFVVNQGDATLSVIDPAGRVVLGHIPVGHRQSMPDQVDIDPGSNRAAVSNFNDHALVFVDLASGQILATVDLRPANGRGPRGVAMDIPLGVVVVVHQQSNTVILVSM